MQDKQWQKEGKYFISQLYIETYSKISVMTFPLLLSSEPPVHSLEYFLFFRNVSEAGGPAGNPQTKHSWSWTVSQTVNRAFWLEMGMEVLGSGGPVELSQGSHGVENTGVCKRTILLLAQLNKAGIKRQLECVKRTGQEWKSEPVLSTMATGGLVRRLEEMKTRYGWEEAEVGG